MATKMQHEVFWRGIALRQDFKREKTQQSPVFPDVIFLCFMSTLTWITEKKIKNKGDEFRWKKNMKFHGGGEKMRNASGQQRAVSKVKMSGSEKIKANKNTSNKFFCEDIRQFPP